MLLCYLLPACNSPTPRQRPTCRRIRPMRAPRRFPEDGPAAARPPPLSDAELAALCFPHGVVPEKLRRSPSGSALDEVVLGRHAEGADQCFVFRLKARRGQGLGQAGRTYWEVAAAAACALPPPPPPPPQGRVAQACEGSRTVPPCCGAQLSLWRPLAPRPPPATRLRTTSHCTARAGTFAKCCTAHPRSRRPASARAARRSAPS